MAAVVVTTKPRIQRRRASAQPKSFLTGMSSDGFLILHGEDISRITAIGLEPVMAREMYLRSCFRTVHSYVPTNRLCPTVACWRSPTEYSEPFSLYVLIHAYPKAPWGHSCVYEVAGQAWFYVTTGGARNCVETCVSGYYDDRADNSELHVVASFPCWNGLSGCGSLTVLALAGRLLGQV